MRIDEVDRPQALERARDFVSKSGIHYIFTPNPEMLVDASRDHHFKDVLNRGDLNLCDGTGLLLVSRGRLKRIPGADFIQDLCRLAETENKSVYLLGTGNEKTVRTAAEKLAAMYSRIKIAGWHPGPEIHMDKTGKLQVDEKNITALADIQQKAPDILFVAFGHNKQEKWIAEYGTKFPSVRIAMGVGGALDYLSGNVRRAPGPMRHLGLEWLWRLIREPRRAGRIWKATVHFLYLYLKH